MTDMLQRLPAPEVAQQLTDDFDGLLTCVEITPITHDVTSFTFALPGGAGLIFAPGQYLTITVEVDGVQLERCYTISSSPAQPERPTITVKRSPDGPVSTWLHDQLRVGDVVSAAGPYGLFSTATHPARKVLFLSAGSGITPLMSMTRAMRDQALVCGSGSGLSGPGLGEPLDIVFVHCARTPDDIIFRAELEALAAGGLAAVTIICQDDSPQEVWQGPRGRLTLGALFAAAPDVLDREVFTCGPPRFMAAVAEHLTLIAADPARSHRESFVLDAGAPASERALSGTSHLVTFARSGVTVECDAATTVLATAASAGLRLPSSCQGGVCGTCKSTLLSGQVDMQQAGGIRQREIDEGKFLPCCSTPLGDLEIDA
ncbi:FAD-binding oxidoreductase [Ornithinimicrobium faecis]|uniref:FAD-binding oxidoreductase n=1 Tax=Ornithinimicrobium faecis TaxID=2934158 RepID=A0ABY4YS30_9MICO|nr:hybrid-cluster NAD(P)-dependent oxidoreductase [Ornithinimicrobium sp. HY1793]USQ79399.1 FAD-binding oxidoreductase [Ornithinimicrobium sp. HY1793]